MLIRRHLLAAVLFLTVAAQTAANVFACFILGENCAARIVGLLDAASARAAVSML